MLQIHGATSALLKKRDTHSESPQVRLLLAGKDLESGRLADTVLADQPQHFTRPGDRQAM